MAFLRLGNVFLQLFEGRTVSVELKESIKSYMDIATNINNCEKGLKLATKITNFNINLKESEFDYNVDESVVKTVKPTLKSYSDLILIERDFTNLTLCAGEILKDVKKSELPSLLKLKFVMEEITTHGRIFVQIVNKILFGR